MRKVHTGPSLAEDQGGHRVIACEACGFAHFWPKPSSEELAAYYQNSFYETHSPADWFEKEAAEEPYWRLEHSDRLHAFVELLGTKTGRLLDIGCGLGWLLAYASERGWDSLGIEPSRAAYEEASKRASVRLGTFPEVDASDRAPFDVVNIKLVMEHVPDPSVVLSAIHRLLRPGGIACIEVPNDFNRLQLAIRKQTQKAPWWLAYPVHINYFSFDSLEGTLARNGFEPVLREATYPMEWFLLQGVDYIGKDDVGRACHAQRMALEMNMEAAGLTDVRTSFSRWLAQQGIGREAIVFARKKA
jgi:SAM-dependent methyltransferase